mmetsp:Transcript_2475/g.9322  ORF Transcript_2475/g.9322 Transcript_2475/m.9322 type:complete len:397 (+) Transcript_2475:1615-2805(+)
MIHSSQQRVDGRHQVGVHEVPTQPGRDDDGDDEKAEKLGRRHHHQLLVPVIVLDHVDGEVRSDHVGEGVHQPVLVVVVPVVPIPAVAEVLVARVVRRRRSNLVAPLRRAELRRPQQRAPGLLVHGFVVRRRRSLLLLRRRRCRCRCRCLLLPRLGPLAFERRLLRLVRLVRFVPIRPVVLDQRERDLHRADASVEALVQRREALVPRLAVHRARDENARVSELGANDADDGRESIGGFRLHLGDASLASTLAELPRERLAVDVGAAFGSVVAVVVVVRGCPRGSDGAALAPSVRVERVLEPPRAGPVAGVARDLRRRDARARWVEGVVVAVFGTTGRGRRGQAVDRRASLGLVAEPPVRGDDDDAMKAATGGGSAAMRTGIRGSPARVVREAAALE